MHLAMILIATGLAWSLRWNWSIPKGRWTERWLLALFLFLFPPLLLIMTAISVLCMGPQGQMVGPSAGWFSYLLALGFLGWGGVFCLKQASEGWRSVRQVRSYPQLDIKGRLCRVLDTTVLFAAQIGFWQPELVVSKGLLNTLDSAHLDAVIAHELGHHYYRDTFWFFWLGWIRSFTVWLPNTEALWQELLVLRELRADGWAIERVDALLLAESLLLVVSNPSMQSENFCAAFSRVAPRNRLTERIEALFAEPETTESTNLWFLTWWLLAFFPLVAVPFHT